MSPATLPTMSRLQLAALAATGRQRFWQLLIPSRRLRALLTAARTVQGKPILATAVTDGTQQPRLQPSRLP